MFFNYKYKCKIASRKFQRAFPIVQQVFLNFKQSFAFVKFVFFNVMLTPQKFSRLKEGELF
jgi:hypothetical protein